MANVVLDLYQLSKLRFFAILSKNGHFLFKKQLPLSLFETEMHDIGLKDVKTNTKHPYKGGKCGTGLVSTLKTAIFCYFLLF